MKVEIHSLSYLTKEQWAIDLIPAISIVKFYTNLYIKFSFLFFEFMILIYK